MSRQPMKASGVFLFALAVVLWASAGVANDHGSSHDGGHESGKGRVANRGGGDRGSAHSREVHKDGSHGNADGPGGSSALEHKVFRADGARGGRHDDDDSPAHHDAGEVGAR